MKIRSLLMVIAALFIFGCGNTPQRQYDAARRHYNEVTISIAVVNVVKPIPPAVWQKIQDTEALARLRLAEANAWLAANKELANVEGFQHPLLDPVVIATDVLISLVPGVQIVPPGPAPAPPTQP